ncbi:MAG: hypothetical protein ABW166_04890 [Sedimenticola sp.]
MNTGDQGVNLNGTHGRIHRAQFFLASEFNTISGSSTFHYLISTHTNAAHLNFDVISDGDIEITFRKQVTASVAGNVVPGLNLNDFSAKTAKTIITSNATLSDSGVLWECILNLNSAGKSGGTKVSASRVEEFILKTNDFYTLSIENLNATTIELCTRIGWYEPEV